MKLFLSAAAFLLSSALLAQSLPFRGVALKNTANFSTGDTVLIYDARQSPDDAFAQYLVKGNNGKRYTSARKVKLLEDELSFWQKQWFTEHARSRMANRPNSELRARSVAIDRTYLENLTDAGKLLEDDYLTDHLRQLAMWIHPGNKLPGQVLPYQVKVLNSSSATTVALDCGVLLVSTATIAQCNNSRELVFQLATAMAHAALLNNQKMIQRKQRSSTLFSYRTRTERVGPQYDPDMQQRASHVARQFLESSEITGSEEREYLMRFGTAITAYSWQAMNDRKAPEARLANQRLLDTGMGTEENYLLAVQYLRKQTSDEASAEQALALVKKAQTLQVTRLIDLDKEAVLLNLRLKNLVQARQHLNAYQEGLQSMQAQGFAVEDDLRAASQLLHRVKQMEQPPGHLDQ